MADVRFEEDNYITINRKIFEKPSSSPIIATLVDNGVIKTERHGGPVVFVILAILMFIVIGLFFRYLFYSPPPLDTQTNFAPAVTPTPGSLISPWGKISILDSP